MSELIKCYVVVHMLLLVTVFMIIPLMNKLIQFMERF